MASKSILQWCEARGISRGMFYILDRQGKAPRTFNIGRLRRISDAADLEWERAREAERAAAEAAAPTKATAYGNAQAEA
jgi:predicted DNA-binding transcriptional regulator AlpA